MHKCRVSITYQKDGFTLYYYPHERKLYMRHHHTSIGFPQLIDIEGKLYFNSLCDTFASLKPFLMSGIDYIGIYWRPWDFKPELKWERNRRKSRIWVLKRLRRLYPNLKDMSVKIAQLM